MTTNDVLRVAAVQLSSQASLDENLARCRVLVERAAQRGARLVVLPENFAYFGPESGKRAVAEALGDGGLIQSTLAATARSHGVTIVAGGMPEKSPDAERPFNTCAVLGADGAVVAAYRKIHLFDVDLADGSSLRESSATRGADPPTPVVVDVDGFRVGLSICYDLRFPELYRKLVDLGAELVLVPAAFTLHTGKDHWHVLLRARAIESQTWVLAAAQYGKHPGGRTTYGHSLLVDPWGTVVTDASDGEGVVVGDVDRAVTTRVRGSLPCLSHRRL